MSETANSSTATNTEEQTATNNNETTTKGAQNDDYKEHKSTTKVTCQYCRTTSNLTADDFGREERHFGKDPMTYYYMCPACKRINFKVGYDKMATNVLYEYYEANGK